ncbi:kelch repeat-containing protein [Marinimicrobium sp. ABcell2]|uniref:Kelch repeat-containing protein n=1 Tax=Marinimicrobium sp. ABcell2 TaxID=3069751 RepID=UPI0027B0E788|nr:kelch repeat-containing protein [Marinimicrobium sp. ABcell2]MDQ2075203.1 kelch repeat-containing protein [Marinimicrobium sp. ABcell2]
MPLKKPSAETQRKAAKLLSSAAMGVALGVVAACSPQNTTHPEATSSDQLQWQEHKASTSPSARHENGFVAVGERLYLLGGRGERPLDIFDPATGSWSQGAKPPFEIHHMQAIAYDEKLYVLGAMTGGFPEEPSLANILIYDPATDSWSTGPEIPADRRRGASGVVVHEGLIYLVGGNTRGHMSGYVPWLDVFDPETESWTQLPDAPHARDHFHAAVIDGQIYAAAGRTSSHDTGEVMSLTVGPVDVYDIADQRWHTLEAPLPTQRAGTATLTFNGLLVVLGGESGSQVESHHEVEAYNPETNQWVSLPPLPVGRHGTQATLFEDELHIVAGSENRGGGPELNDHWILGTEE